MPDCGCCGATGWGNCCAACADCWPVGSAVNCGVNEVGGTAKTGGWGCPGAGCGASEGISGLIFVIARSHNSTSFIVTGHTPHSWFTTLPHESPFSTMSTQKPHASSPVPLILLKKRFISGVSPLDRRQHPWGTYRPNHDDTTQVG
ncbi:hypothetical protein BTHE_1981 [Bifidobacterium thermophilum]|nr:hypothetical protein BTHE_1981 [Bifidobacterium thermophilum]